MTTRREMPIGIQDFEKLRSEEYVYVDKTDYVYQLATTGKPYFLGRPLHFGKSLFLSTLKAYFLGKKELFEGLAIAELEKDWIEYPVLYLDMSIGYCTSIASLHAILDANMRKHERTWNINNSTDGGLPGRFYRLIANVRKQTGRNVVVLVDEYDKPLLDTIENTELYSKVRNILSGFYCILKRADANLKFVFLTGIINFPTVNVFSDLNHLVDISMYEEYAGICGISESELIANFQPEIPDLADELGKNCDETLTELKKHCGGYHFAKKSEGMYDTFSLLSTFYRNTFGDYWFDTQDPTFLVKMLKDEEFDVKDLEKDVSISANFITDYRAEDKYSVPLLYQKGYLTIKDYDDFFREYILGFPNDALKYDFFKELLRVYMPGKNLTTKFCAANFVRDLLNNNIDAFMSLLSAFFAGMDMTEKYFKTVFFILFRSMRQFVEVEQRSAAGRADAVITTKDTVFIFEFKIDETSTVEKAVQQIDDKSYAISYTAKGKKIVKIGVTFGKEKGGITEWKIENE
jgi:hypothetical protein